MRFFQGKQNGSVASAGLLVTLVTVVWCASCGSTKNTGLSGDDGTNGSDGGGDDATTGCTGFGACASSSGGGDDGGFASGDSGPPVIKPVNGPVNDTNCPAGTAASIWTSTSNAASIKWLYPYDVTVFPGGLAQPLMQWSQSGTPTDVYLHLSSKKYDWKGCYKASSPLQVQIDATSKEWATAYAQSGGKSDPLTVELRTSSGGTVSMAKETWTFAKGSLAGDVYYNTYDSKIVPGQAAGGNGAVIKIENGKAQALLYTAAGASPFGPCVSCHSLSSNGSMLVAQQHFYPGGLNGLGSMSFDLTKTPMPDVTKPVSNAAMDDWGLSAVYPDGSLLLTNGQPTDSNAVTFGVFPAGVNDVPGMIGPKPSVMYDPNSGATISFSGLTTQYAMMPMFSSDGKHIVYNDYGGDAGAANGHTLTVMDFDVGSKTFSNGRQIFSDPSKYPGWPFFTPDGKQVLFTLGNAPNFASDQMPPNPAPNAAQLYTVDVATKTAHRLDMASGYNGSTEYLPFPGRDENLDFFTTVNPISAGGYFWVYFTSRRQYGNSVPAGATVPRARSTWPASRSGSPPSTSTRRPAPISSHPAFYLPGQELGSGNVRAFAVLAPCKGDGSGCESGIDCCGGSCTMGKCSVPQACAATNDRCTPTVPCCSANDLCLGGYCGVAPPK